MKNSKERFSKKIVSETIYEHIHFLEEKNNFKPYKGWDQVNGEGEAINREYGKYVILLDLIEEFNL